MNLDSFDDLVTPDERSLRFTPIGLSMRGLLRPEDAFRFQKQAVDVPLAPDMPGSTQDSFRRLQLTHVYGILRYDLFTVAAEQSLLVLEQGLGERFIDFYAGTVPFVASDGSPAPLTASTLSQVADARRRGGSHMRKGMKLQLRARAEPMAFNGGLGDLLRWARAEQLLHGQRNRHMEHLLTRARNRVAHSDSYSLGSPVDSARSIRDVGEILNRVWGQPTPGGRLYPGPLRRDIFAIGWDAAGRSISRPTLEQLVEPITEPGYTYVLVRMAPEDERWPWFDSLYETTALPAELLWGPGSRDHALAWAERERPQADAVEHLDRVFLFRMTDGDVGLPRRADVVAGLPTAGGEGTWYAVRADSPGEARIHARSLVEGDPSCGEAGPCRRCAAEALGHGTREELIDALRATGTPVDPVAPPDVRVPLHHLR